MESRPALKIPLSDMMYYLYFFVLFGSRSLGIIEGTTLYKIVLVSGIFLYLLKELLTKKSLIEHAVSIGLLSVAALVYLSSGEKGLLLYFTMMLGMKGIRKESIMKLALYILAVCFPLMALTSMLHLRYQYQYNTYRAFCGLVTRYSWGYPGPNVTHTTFIILLCLLLCCLKVSGRRQLICTGIMMGMAGVYVFMFTFSYTGMIGCIVCIGAYCYLNSRKRLGLIEKAGLVSAYPALGMISIGVPLLLPEEIFWKMDSFFHNRFNYSRYFLKTEPITLLGTRFGAAPNKDYYVDSAYIYSFLQIGIVPFLILTGLFIWLVVDCIKRDQRNELAVILTFSIIGLSDPFLYNLAYKNVMFLWYGELIYRTLGEVQWSKESLWGREPEIFTHKWGEQTIAIPGRWLEPVRRMKERVKKHWDEHCIRQTACFTAGFAVIFAALLILFGRKQIDGRFDTPEEWLVFYHYMNLSIAAAVLLLCVIGFGISRRRSAS